MLTQLQNDMKQALKSGEKQRLSTLRMLIAAVKYESIEKRHELSADEIQTVIAREIKQRVNVIEDFKKGGRDDLVKQAEEEIATLGAYLPAQLNDDELAQLISQAMEEAQVSSGKEIGKIMAKLMPKIKGKADGSRVQAMVRQMLPK